MAYRDIYAESSADDVGQLQLLTSPLAATEEVLNLYSAGLVPVDLAMPAVLHAIGTTKEDIDRAVEEAKKADEDKKAVESSEQEFAKKDRELSFKERETALEGQKKENQQIGKDKPAASSSSAGGS